MKRRRKDQIRWWQGMERHIKASKKKLKEVRRKLTAGKDGWKERCQSKKTARIKERGKRVRYGR